MKEFTEDKKQNEGKNNGKYDVEYPFSFVEPVHKNEKNYGQGNEGDEHEGHGIDDHRRSGNQEKGKIAPLRFVGLEVFFLFPYIGHPQNKSENDDDGTDNDGKIPRTGSAVHGAAGKTEGRNHKDQGQHDTDAGKDQTRYTHPSPLGQRRSPQRDRALK
jgi:hypothetical protein